MSEPIPTPEAFAKSLANLLASSLMRRADNLQPLATRAHIEAAIRSRDDLIRRAAMEEAAKVAIEFMQENHELRISIQRTDDLADAIRSA